MVRARIATTILLVLTSAWVMAAHGAELNVPVTVALRDAPISNYLAELSLPAGRPIEMDGLPTDDTAQPTLTFSCQDVPLLRALRALGCLAQGFFLSGLDYDALSGSIHIQGAWVSGTASQEANVTFRGGRQTLGEIFSALSAELRQPLKLDGADATGVVDCTFGFEKVDARRALYAVCALTGMRPISDGDGWRIVPGLPVPAPQVHVGLPGKPGFDVVVSGLERAAESWTPRAGGGEVGWQSRMRSVQQYPQGEFVHDEQQLGFLPPTGLREPPSPQSYLRLELRLESDDPKALLSLVQVGSGASLTDDRGGEHSALQQALDQGGAPSLSRQAVLVFDKPPSDATLAKTLQGEFAAFEKAEIIEFSFPSDAAVGTEQDQSGVLVRLVNYQADQGAQTVNVSYEVHVPPIKAAAPGQANVLMGVEFHLIDSLDTLIETRVDLGAEPVEGQDAQGRQAYRVHITYQLPLWRPAARHTFSVLLRENATVKYPFRIEAIPLPREEK